MLTFSYDWNQETERCLTLRITVGYPTLAQRGSGRYVFEAAENSDWRRLWSLIFPFKASMGFP